MSGAVGYLGDITPRFLEIIFTDRIALALRNRPDKHLIGRIIPLHQGSVPTNFAQCQNGIERRAFSTCKHFKNSLSGLFHCKFTYFLYARLRNAAAEMQGLVTSLFASCRFLRRLIWSHLDRIHEIGTSSIQHIMYLQSVHIRSRRFEVEQRIRTEPRLVISRRNHPPGLILYRNDRIEESRHSIADIRLKLTRRHLYGVATATGKTQPEHIRLTGHDLSVKNDT